MLSCGSTTTEELHSCIPRIIDCLFGGCIILSGPCLLRRDNSQKVAMVASMWRCNIISPRSSMTYCDWHGNFSDIQPSTEARRGTELHNLRVLFMTPRSPHLLTQPQGHARSSGIHAHIWWGRALWSGITWMSDSVSHQPMMGWYRTLPAKP